MPVSYTKCAEIQPKTQLPPICLESLCELSFYVAAHILIREFYNLLLFMPLWNKIPSQYYQRAEPLGSNSYNLEMVHIAQTVHRLLCENV